MPSPDARPDPSKASAPQPGLRRRGLLRSAAASAMLAAPAIAGSRALAQASPAGGFTPAGLQRLQRLMAGHVADGQVPGIVWAVHRGTETHVGAEGRLALDGAPMQRDSIFRIASLTKLVTAAAAMILVEERRLRLDDPVDAHLPELAERRVLKRPGAPLGESVPARRPITLRDLLTLRMGLGAVLVYPPEHPIQQAMAEAEVAPSAAIFPHDADTFMQRLGGLPLVHQPGEGWLYHTGLDVAGVLVARASGQSLGAFMRTRIFEPLGMPDTGFHVPADKLERLATAYQGDGSGGLAVWDAAHGGRFAGPPAFESGGGGLVSTVDDFLRFCRMLLGQGSLGQTRILSPASVALMTTDQLTAEQRASAPLFFRGSSGWGLGMAVARRRDQLWMTPGRFGWDGGYGTSAYVDPQTGLIGVLMTQRLMQSPQPPAVFTDFWASAYTAMP